LILQGLLIEGKENTSRSALILKILYKEIVETVILCSRGLIENEVSSVDPNCGCFTVEQATLIAQAQEIIKNAPIH
jgi:hypothetical protein